MISIPQLVVVELLKHLLHSGSIANVIVGGWSLGYNFAQCTALEIPTISWMFSIYHIVFETIRMCLMQKYIPNVLFYSITFFPI